MIFAAAAALGAARAVLASGLRLAGDVWITAVVGHEEAEAAKDGPRAFVDDVNAGLVPADRIVIVEGDEALWMMSMGSAAFAITLDSDSGGAHADGVPFARNPIRHVGRLIEAFAALQERLDAGARHPLAGAERIDVGIARAGDYHNRTPGTCYLEATRRWAPGSTVADIRAELEEIIGRIATEGGLRWRLKLMMDCEPFEVAADDPCLRAFAAAAQRVTGTAPPLVGRCIVGDANLDVHGCGRPTFYYGLAYRTVHADVEWVSVEALVRTARVYVAGAAGYCGHAGGRWQGAGWRSGGAPRSPRGAGHATQPWRSRVGGSLKRREPMRGAPSPRLLGRSASGLWAVRGPGLRRRRRARWAAGGGARPCAGPPPGPASH